MRHARSLTAFQRAQTALAPRHGLICASVDAYAAALDVEANVFLAAVYAADIEIVFDSAKNASEAETHTRPDDPDVRRICVRDDDFEAIVRLLPPERPPTNRPIR
jgi:hypothetical protein